MVTEGNLMSRLLKRRVAKSDPVSKVLQNRTYSFDSALQPCPAGVVQVLQASPNHGHSRSSLSSVGSRALRVGGV